MGQMQVDDMTVEILFTALHNFRAKSVETVSKNVFEKITLMVALKGTDPC